MSGATLAPNNRHAMMHNGLQQIAPQSPANIFKKLPEKTLSEDDKLEKTFGTQDGVVYKSPSHNTNANNSVVQEPNDIFTNNNAVLSALERRQQFHGNCAQRRRMQDLVVHR